VLNRDGGTLRTMDLLAFCEEAKGIFEAAGHEIDCRIVSGIQVNHELEEAARSDADAILAAGGDGTISSAASIAMRSGKPLAVLPAGTMNLFARSLGLPLELSAALSAIAGGQTLDVDIAMANGRPFVHQFSVGIHARLVRIREQMSYASRSGKLFASLRAIATVAIRPPVFEAELHTRDGSSRHEVSGISITNNPLGEGHLPYADRLDTGVLGVYLAAPLSTSALMRLATDVFLGSWQASPQISGRHVAQVTLTFPKRKRNAFAVLDGELIRLEQAVTLRIEPGGLKMIVPSPVALMGTEAASS
jgi:diacylglycerol kinase family enzyme